METTNNTVFVSSALSRAQRSIGGYSISQILNIVQCALGGLVLVVNLIFLIILAIGRWRLQRPKRYVLSANLSLSDAISGMVLIALALVVLFELYGGSVMRWLLETAMSASFAMCTLSCNGVFRMQYVAVHRPWRYFLYLTKARLFAIIALIWTIAHAYAFAKGYVLFYQTTNYARVFAICELGVMGGAWLINACSYVYVLREAAKKVRSHQARIRGQPKGNRASARLLKENSKEISEDDEDATRHCCSPESEYTFLVTVGLNLFVFFLSFAPLWVNWIMALYRRQEVYFDQHNTVTRHLLLLVCFLRAIFEPVVHILRQPKLLCRAHYRDSID